MSFRSAAETISKWRIESDWRQKEREEWESENPEIAAAWSEANKIEWEKQTERERLEDIEREIFSFQNSLARFGIPERCADVVVSPSETPALKAIREFLDQRINFCLLVGGAGVGKSVAAAWGLFEFGCRKIRATKFRHGDGQLLFVRASDIARMSAYGEENHERFGEYCKCKLLVIDDLGAERQSDMWLALLDELIDRRYGDKRQTILTTNLDAETFKKRYGERIADRIRQDGVVCGAGAESLRKRGAA